MSKDEVREHDQQALPLRDMKVVDISTMLAAGHISTILGDFGAEVIKVEHPRGDPIRRLGWTKAGTSLWWKLIGRNKICVTLNLSKREGQQILRRLVREADVLIENFRPGTLEKWHLGYEDLKPENPRLIMVRVTGFGQYGPYSNRPGFGTLAEAISGSAHLTGFLEGPPILPPLGLADYVASLFGAIAAMICVYHRDVRQTREGQYVDLSLFEPLFSILGPQVTVYDQLGIVIGREGNRSPFAAPRNLYQTSDGRWVALSASTQSIAERVLRAIDREDLIDDERFRDNESRVENNDELDAIISDWISRHTVKEVVQRFAACGAAIAPVYDVSHICGDAHYAAREAIVSVLDPSLGELKMQNVVPKLSKTPGRIRFAGPELGQHNREIYVERLGFSDDELVALRESGVI